MEEVEIFSVRTYFRTLTGVLNNPRRYFSDQAEKGEFKKPAVFLIVSSLIFTAASYIVTNPPDPLKAIAIYFVNALGMSLIATVLGYLTMVLLFGRRVPFSRLFYIFSLSSGVTLLASWVPYFIWFTEPWKWWLIGVGLVVGCGFRWYQALIIIFVTVFIMVGFFWALFSTLF